MLFRPGFIRSAGVASLRALACSLLTAQGLLAQTVVVPASGENDFAYDAGNHMLYIAAGSSIERYDVQTNQSLSPIVINGGQSQLTGIDVSPDGTTLAVSDGASGTNSNWIWQVNTATNAVTQVDFTKTSREEGTYSIAYDAEGRVLVSSLYNGSGFTPLRLYNPSTSTTTTVATPFEGAVLTPTANHSAIVVANEGLDPGSVQQFNTSTSGLQQDVSNLPFSPYDAAMSPGGELIVPSYGGGYVFNSSFQAMGTLGVYATDGPLDAVYSPNGSVLYTTWWNRTGSQQIYEFSPSSLVQIGTLNAFGGTSGSFSDQSGRAFNSGEIKISPDGTLLFTGLGNAVSIITVPEPSSLILASLGLVALAMFARRRLRLS